jgi:flagellar biosynthesis regulator FlaF
MRSLNATVAYQRAITYQNPRQREAELFRSVGLALAKAHGSDSVTVAKALADNELLWIAVMDLLRDPANLLPLNTRAAIMSVGYAARREVASKKPDLAFLSNLNEQIAAGLGGPS